MKNIFTLFTDAMTRLFGGTPAVSAEEIAEAAEQAYRYRRTDALNLTAVFANKLAALALTDSFIDLNDPGGGTASKRAEFLNEALVSVWSHAQKWGSMALGTGGVLLIPRAAGGRIYTDIVSQDRLLIKGYAGDELTAVTILADSCVVGETDYNRWTDYRLDGDVLTIRSRATKGEVTPQPLSVVPAWAGIPEEIRLRGVKHLPFAFIKCPADNRRSEHLYGVPITYGCEALMAEISECLAQIRSEYDLKRPLVGMDKTLFERGENGRPRLPRTGLFTPLQPGGLNEGGKRWEIFDPEIRESAYHARLDHLYALLEKQVGTSRGILTEPASRGATATEIKAALFDTYALITHFRTEIEKGMRRLAEAMEVLANAYNLAPAGEWELSFDWSYALIESSQETFQQLVTAQQSGAVEAAEVRQYIKPDESLEEAREHVAEISERAKNSANQLLNAALAVEARNNGL